MKATELTGVKAMKEIRLPDPVPGRDQVVVKPEAVGVCGSDLSAFRGIHPRMVPPLVLGHEFAGRVVEIGDDVPEETLGSRVAVDPIVPCGACEPCVEGRSNICQNYRLLGCRPGLPGALAEMVVADFDKVWELPADCTFVAGALVQPLAVSHHAVIKRAQVVAGEEVAIIGAGPIGLGALMFALARGSTTSVVDIDPYRLALAKEIGAQRTMTVEEAADATGAPRVVLECVGGRQSSTLDMAVSWVRPGGTVVIVGNFAGGTQGVDPVTVKVKELDVLGSQAYTDSYGPVVEMVRAHQIDAEAMVSHVLPLEDPMAALDLLDDADADSAKVVMTSTSDAAV